MGNDTGRVRLAGEAFEFYASLLDIERLIECIDLSFVERKRTPGWAIQVGIGVISSVCRREMPADRLSRLQHLTLRCADYVSKMALDVVVDPGILLGAGFAALAALSVAVTSLGIRLGTDHGRTTDALSVVLLCNLVLIVPATLILYFPTYNITMRAALAFVGAGITGTLFGRVCYFTSISRIGSSRTEPIKATQPLHATLVAVVVLGEAVRSLHMAGILLVVVGVAVLTWEMAATESSGQPGQGAMSGLLFAFGAAFFFGLEAVWARSGFVEGGSLLLGLTIRLLAAGLGFFGYLWIRGLLPRPSTIRRADLRWYIFAGVANTLFLGAYYAALQAAPVSLVVPIVQTSPLIVALLSFLFLPTRLERVSPVLLASAVIIVGGAILITLTV